MPFDPAPKTEEQQRTALGRRALEAIAAHILTVPDDELDMRNWCGTARCAVGHSLRLPEVVATGLSYKGAYGRLDVFVYGTDAVAEAFGMTFQDAMDLFGNKGSMNNPTTMSEVAGNIRDYLVRTR